MVVAANFITTTSLTNTYSNTHAVSVHKKLADSSIIRWPTVFVKMTKITAKTERLYDGTGVPVAIPIPGLSTLG